MAISTGWFVSAVGFGMTATILYFHLFGSNSYHTCSRASYDPSLAIPQRSCGEQLRFNLQGANLEGANLSGAKLANANLKNANLNRANLTGADLGCSGITFNLEANEKEANMDFNVSAVPEKNNPENAVVGFNMKATDRGATMRFNLPGCADLENASLQETKMPDGKIHP